MVSYAAAAAPAVQGVIIHAVLHEYPSNDTVEMTVNATFEAGVAALVVESYRSLDTGIEMSDIGLVLNQSRLLTFFDDVNQAVVAKILGEPAQGVQGYAAWNARLEDANGTVVIRVDYRFEPASTVPVTIRGQMELRLDPAVPIPYTATHTRDTVIEYGNETEQRHSIVEANISVEGLQGPAEYRIIESGRVYLLASVQEGGSLKLTIQDDKLDAENTGGKPGYILVVYKSGYAIADQVPFYTLRILAPGEDATLKLPRGHGLPLETLEIGGTGSSETMLALAAAVLALAGVLAAWRLKR
ncbi:MAG: hypothetical protein GSR78_02565 [Desulfurococcales archaeon]|nr:hypothetical protein [Desulfurococcales archaeon]